jgi:indolepyruvate ferredoxin oxidoreductase, beta subunit
MNRTINFLLCGVGGQGTILASDVLVNVGLSAGFQAKQAEVHGMSQRGGSVTSHVRWAKVVHSPLIGMGEADVLLAFEKLEALRNLRSIHPDALVLINNRKITPLTVTSGDLPYPADETIKEAFTRVSSFVNFINGEELAGLLGNVRVENVILLGALSALLETHYSDLVTRKETWLEVISGRVPPKHLELNLKAFQAGRDAIEKRKRRS